MERNHWLQLFNINSWAEFISSGAEVVGFKKTRENIFKKINPGDYLLCYCTGIRRYVGLLEVTGPLYWDDRKIWSDDLLPWRFPVKALIVLKPEHGVPINSLKNSLSIFQNDRSPNVWKECFLRLQIIPEDSNLIIEAMRVALSKSQVIPYDSVKSSRKPEVFQTFDKDGGIVPITEN